MRRVKPRTSGTRRRPGIGTVLFRQLPVRSAVHRMWPGTKLTCLLVLTIVAVLFPGWPAAFTTTAVLITAAIAARVPANAVPRLPLWTWGLFALGALTSAFGQGIGTYCQSLLIAVGLAGLGAVLAWTTPIEGVAPAVTTLAAPLRRLGLPIGEWSLILALCLRSLPLLTEEFKVLLAARRLRRGRRHRSRMVALPGNVIDLITAATAAATRRANELGQAITVRGGAETPAPALPRLRLADGAALTVSLLACALIIGASLAPNT